MASKSLGAALLLLAPTQAWYLPGVAPHDFNNGERVYLKVNKLTSTRTQVGDEQQAPPFVCAVRADGGALPVKALCLNGGNDHGG